MAYGERIRQYRELRKLTQDDLARQADIPSTSISRIEHGLRKVTLEEAVRLAEVLQIDLTALAGVSSSETELSAMKHKAAECKERLQRIQTVLEACELDLAAFSVA